MNPKPRIATKIAKVIFFYGISIERERGVCQQRLWLRGLVDMWGHLVSD